MTPTFFPLESRKASEMRVLAPAWEKIELSISKPPFSIKHLKRAADSSDVSSL